MAQSIFSDLADSSWAKEPTATEINFKIEREKLEALKYMASHQSYFDKVKMDAVYQSILSGAGSLGPAGGSVGVGVMSPKESTPRPLSKHTSEQLTVLIRQRMRVEWVPVDFITCHCASDDKVRVFVVHKDQAVILEDDALFPSDTLMGQIKLIIG